MQQSRSEYRHVNVLLNMFSTYGWRMGEFTWERMEGRSLGVRMWYAWRAVMSWDFILGKVGSHERALREDW